jgi:uncharacterized protein YcfJ
MNKHLVASVFLVLATACAAPGGPSGKVLGSRTCDACGTVRGIDVMNTRSGNTSGAGAVMGAVVGAVVGHQFGSGRGNTAATAGGAVAGAYAGNEIEKERRDGGRYYRVTIDMDRGYTETVNVGDPEQLRSGDRVRVIGNNIEIIS